jgi:hypothetical protein
MVFPFKNLTITYRSDAKQLGFSSLVKYLLQIFEKRRGSVRPQEQLQWINTFINYQNTHSIAENRLRRYLFPPAGGRRKSENLKQAEEAYLSPASRWRSFIVPLEQTSC